MDDVVWVVGSMMLRLDVLGRTGCLLGSTEYGTIWTIRTHAEIFCLIVIPFGGRILIGFLLLGSLGGVAACLKRTLCVKRDTAMDYSENIGGGFLASSDLSGAS